MITDNLTLQQKAVIAELVHRSEAGYSVPVEFQSDSKTMDGLENRNIIVVLQRRRVSPLLDYTRYTVAFTAAAAYKFGLKHKVAEPAAEPAASPEAEPIVVAFEKFNFYVDCRSDTLIAVYRDRYPLALASDIVKMIGETPEANIHLVKKPMGKSSYSKRRDEVWRCIEDALANHGLPLMHLQDLSVKPSKQLTKKQQKVRANTKPMFPD